MIYKEAKLGDYIDILSGFAFKTKDFVEKGVPIIKIKNICPPSVTLEDLSYVSNEVAEKQKKFVLSYDDVLIAMTGSHINQWASVVGRVARVKYNDKTLLNQRVGKIIIKEDIEVDINYIYYFLSQDEIKIKLAAKAGGTANQANISSTHIKELTFPCPDCDIQKKIADILKSYDDLIENNQKQIKLLEEAAQRLYKEWFVDLRFPGYEDCEIVDGVPVGWMKDTLNDYCEIKSGYAFKSKDWQNIGCGVIKIKDINNGFVNYSACDCVPTDVAEKAKLYYLRKGDLLIAMTGATIGKIGISTKDGYYANQRVGKVFLGDNPLERLPFAYCVLSLQSSLEHILNNSSASSAQPNISGEKIGDIEIIYSQDTIDKFNRILQPLFKKMILLRQNIEKLGKARDLLLLKLMSGEIEV